MEKLLAKWQDLCASSAVARFVDVNLRGIGQVMFQDNPLTGALFLVAIASPMYRMWRLSAWSRSSLRR